MFHSACRWYARCAPDRLLDFPAGELESCLEVASCQRARQPEAPLATSACIEAIAEADCARAPEVVLFDEVCLGAPARAGDGEPCLDRPCADGLYCDDSGISPCFVCKPVKALGDDCASANTCRGDDCFFPAECGRHATCIAGTCAEHQAEGEFCDFSGHCESSSCVDNACRATGSEGSTCRFSTDCDIERGLVCVGGVCDRRKADGEACTIDELGVSSCQRGLACTVGVCTPLRCRAPEPNDPCNPLDCGGDLYCSDEGRCTPRSAAGEACGTGAWECREGLFCDGSLCQALAGPGEACTIGGCADGLRCMSDTNTCAAPRPAGEPCGSFFDCAGLACDGGACTGGDVCEASE